MQEHEKPEFAQLLRGVSDFYGRDLSPFALSVWWEAMRPFDHAAVVQAMNRHVMNPDTGQFMPKPADVVRMLGGTTQDSALRAWAKVDRALRHVGPYPSVAFDDPLIHRVLHDMGGWVGLGTKTEDDWPFVAREFESRYRGYAMRGERPDYPALLIGLAEADNARRGLKSDAPRLIGDAEKAMQVIQGGTDRPLISFATANVAPAPEQGLRLVERGAA